MPARKLESALRRKSVIDEHEITKLRNEYLIEIAKLAAEDTAVPLIAKPQELLKSRYWANSTWRERGKIFDTVNFLLRTHAAR